MPYWLQGEIPFHLPINSVKSRSRYYKPEKTGWLVFFICGTLFAGATWVTLTSVHNQQQITHCEQGWQRACESLSQ